jgi:hypothetical protein
MSAAMILLYEEAYYAQGYTDLGVWKLYLKNMEDKE